MEAYEHLGELIQARSTAERKLLLFEERHAQVVDTLFDTAEFLDAGRVEQARELLDSMSDVPGPAVMEESFAGVAHRVAADARKAAMAIASGQTVGSDELLSALRERLATATGEQSLANIYLSDEADTIMAAVESRGNQKDWGILSLPVPVRHPRAAAEIPFIPIPPAKQQTDLFAERLRHVENRVNQVIRLQELGSPAVEAEAAELEQNVAALVEIARGVALDYPSRDERVDLETSIPDPSGTNGVGIAYVPNLWTPGAGDQREARILAQRGDTIRLLDLDGNVDQEWPNCAWNLRGATNRFAFFCGEVPRVVSGHLVDVDVGVFDTVEGRWVELWPGHLTDLGNGPLGILGTGTCTVVERTSGRALYATDALRSVSRVFDEGTDVVAWEPFLDVVWARRGGSSLLLRTLGGVTPVEFPEDFEQHLDVEINAFGAARPEAKPTLTPILRESALGHVFVTANGAVFTGGLPVLQLVGDNMVAVDIDWPTMLVQTPDRVLIIDLGTKDEDGFGADCSIRRVLPI